MPKFNYSLVKLDNLKSSKIQVPKTIDYEIWILYFWTFDDCDDGLVVVHCYYYFLSVVLIFKGTLKFHFIISHFVSCISGAINNHFSVLSHRKSLFVSIITRVNVLLGWICVFLVIGFYSSALLQWNESKSTILLFISGL